jgi:hypothetical protein
VQHYSTGKLQPEFPLNYLPRLLGNKREQLEAEGFSDLREVPDAHLSKAQARVKEHSVSGEIYFDALGAQSDLTVYGFPAYFAATSGLVNLFAINRNCCTIMKTANLIHFFF